MLKCLKLLEQITNRVKHLFVICGNGYEEWCEAVVQLSWSLLKTNESQQINQAEPKTSAAAAMFILRLSRLNYFLYSNLYGTADGNPHLNKYIVKLHTVNKLEFRVAFLTISCLEQSNKCALYSLGDCDVRETVGSTVYKLGFRITVNN